MFKTRLLSGIVLVIIALITVITGQDLLFGVLLVISLIGMSELYKVVDVHKKLLGFTGYLAGIAYYVCLRFGSKEQIVPLIIGFLVLLMAVYVFSFPKYIAQQVMFVFFGLFYVALMLSYVYQTRMLPQGAFLVWLIFLCSWGSDTCAYCVGMLIGKHKMAPVLSPKKSIEGGVGGVLGAALLGALYALLISNVNQADGHTPLMYAVICAVGALISMVGDLAASAIKRNKEIKDYGKLIPGHGGILDRFDSVIFTAPFIYFLASVLI